MILDFHTHAVRPDPNMPAEYRAFLSTRRGEGLDEFLESYSHPENFLALLDEAGVDYAVVLAETAFITSAVIPNDHIQKFTAASKGRLIPFCTFNPYMVLNPAKGLEVAIQEQGFRGLKLYPTYEYFYPNQPMLYPLYAKAQELGIPVMAHTGSSVFAGSRLKYGDPLFWDDVAVDFPDLTIILCHGGRMLWYDRAAALVRLHKNVYFDVSGLPPQRLLDYWPDLERLSGKVLFGSDWPDASIGNNLETFRTLTLSEEAKHKILWANGSRILSIKE
ncbi:MAG: amidohydrolase family protein [Acidobacteria bacterium]|nr:amidohydrolase family protein [Acidobacteriota bacterium]